MSNLESFTNNSPTILISRTDSIGDVVLTLPMAGVLKQLYPNSKVIFLGKTYTEPIVKCCSYIDEFLNWDTISKCNLGKQLELIKQENIDIFINVFPSKEIATLAKKAKIPIRIGTSHRVYNWLYCNKKIKFSRKNSDLHESQLNIKLIECLGAKTYYNIDELNKNIGIILTNVATPAYGLIDINKFNLILHPKSKGSAREWGEDNFNRLISLLSEEKFNIFITGTKQEGDLIRESIIEKNKDRIHDMTGQFSLKEFISFIDKTDGLIAASTGPLHIASVLGKHSLGLYPPIHPMHPGRWKPIGENTKVFCKEKKCSQCRKENKCKCMQSITPEEVAEYLNSLL